MKEELNNTKIKNLKPKAKLYEVADATLVHGLDIRGLTLRVMPSGVKSFVLTKRFPGSKHPVRRALARYPSLTLGAARQKADEWNRLLKRKIDPQAEETRQIQDRLLAETEKREAERKQKENTFGNAFEVYLRDKASKQRAGREIERVMRQEFTGWMDRPLANIAQSDVKKAIKAITSQGMTAKAYYAFDSLRAFCNWACDSGDFGTTVSPCAGLKANVLIGPRNVRDRVLRDFELAAYWRAAEKLGYPFGKLFHLLALTALRRDEAANAEWSEIDMAAKLWSIPATRMKNGAAHAVPLTHDIALLLGGCRTSQAAISSSRPKGAGGGQFRASRRPR